MKQGFHPRLGAFLCGCLLYGFATQEPGKEQPARKPAPATSPGVTVSAGLTREELAAEAAVNEMLKAGRAHLAAKDCPQAMASFEAALERAEARVLSGSRRGAFQQEALKEIAECQFASKKLEDAEATLLRRKQVLLDWGGPFESAIGHNSLELAAIQIERQKWTQAERYAREALAVYDAGIAHFRMPGRRDEQDFLVANISRSKVTGLYVLGLSLALQRRSDEALKTWDEGYRLGVQFHARPETLMQMVIQAIEVHDLLKLTANRPLWVERLRQLRAQEQATKKPG
jgi:tetratricopeptide (TPR) repeat protein